MADTDRFWFLDHAPDGQRSGEARGAPWYPHHGFETITYVLDGDVAHRNHRWRRHHRQGDRDG